MCSAPARKTFITPENSLLPPYKLLINGKLAWCGTKGRGREGSVGPLLLSSGCSCHRRDVRPCREGKKSPFECTLAGIVRALWALMHAGFILRIQIRRYYDDWQLEENGECCLIQCWKGLMALGDVSFHHWLGLGESGPSLSVVSQFKWGWISYSPPSSSVNNPQDTERWVIKITNIFQYNCDECVFLYFLIFPLKILLALLDSPHSLYLDWLLVGSLAAVPLFSVFSHCCRIWNCRFLCVREFHTWLSSQRTLQCSRDRICTVVTEEPVPPCPTPQTPKGALRILFS